VDAVDRELARDPGSPIVLDVLGTLDPDEVRAKVRDLEPDMEEIFWFRASVGAVFGVRRRDGTRIALKIHSLFRDETYFDDVQRLQLALAELGFPSPRALGRTGLATREEWLDAGEFLDAHVPAVRRVLAKTLFRLHRLATATGIRPRRPFLRPVNALWPKPHNALFDFEATARGAEWIDEIAVAARAVTDIPVGREVVGHSDWSVKHLRFDHELRPTALYDWDSVTVDSEPLLVGTAAGSFTYTEELPYEIAVWPATAESVAFLDEYEAERPGPFTFDERKAAEAACVYLRAYAARCHHAVGGDADETGLSELAEALL
jgi:Phosphotransferase enzyme family